MKLKSNFGPDLEYGKKTGKCTKSLYTFLVLLRHKMPHNNQYSEGLNNILQQFSKMAPNLKRPTANVKMSGKIGERLEPSQCVQLHDQVDKHRTTHPYRYGEVIDMPTRGIQDRPSAATSPVHSMSPVTLHSVGFAVKLARNRQLGGLFCYSLSANGGANVTRAFLMGNAYYSSVRCTLGGLRHVGGMKHFTLRLPFCVDTLLGIITDFPVRYRVLQVSYQQISPS